MTILNRESDGMHGQVIALAAVAAKYGPIDKTELLTACSVHGNMGRLRAALARWLEFGLFTEESGKIKLNIERKRGAPLEAVLDTLPTICRRLVLQEQHCLPLTVTGEAITEKGGGRAADFARGLSWALAQDIYNLPDSAKGIEALEGPQVNGDLAIFQNDTRWPGLRPWARYLGFATGEKDFLFDPTEAVRSELSTILGVGESMAATVFLDELSDKIPVLDGGTYRQEVEANLRQETWRKPAEGHLSMSLSIALRRLELNGSIALETKSDSGSVVKLTGRNYRTWTSFTHVRMSGGRA
ncbi:protein DpdG [Duganella fentianensis]|uniref:protein DpdG n=1 Tax=Duganella fentianensis TaxID=2692177 RepID=UPI0032B21D0F